MKCIPCLGRRNNLSLFSNCGFSNETYRALPPTYRLSNFQLPSSPGHSMNLLEKIESRQAIFHPPVNGGTEGGGLRTVVCVTAQHRPGEQGSAGAEENAPLHPGFSAKRGAAGEHHHGGRSIPGRLLRRRQSGPRRSRPAHPRQVATSVCHGVGGVTIREGRLVGRLNKNLAVCASRGEFIRRLKELLSAA